MMRLKKWIALWSALLMMISILPVMPVSAEEVSALEQAKLCIDTILTAAPAPEDYTFSEELADEVDKLGKLLQTGLSTSEIDTLDAYVATKTTSEVPGEDETTTETVTRYQSVQKFYQDYADAQNAALEELAAPIHTAVDAMLARPLTRENYKTASESYANASAHIKAAVDADDVNALNQIRELLELVDSADRAFLRIEMLKADASAGDYNLFLEDVQSAKTAYGLYESKFAELRRYTKYADCLIKAMKNSLFENYEKYEKANIIADVEQAYDDLGVYDVLDDTVKEKLDVLQDAVDAGAASNFSLSVYDYYRGEAIQYVLTQYRNIETFEEMIALTSETPKNKIELTAALRAYRYYNQELTADEQDLVAPELVKKMNNAVLLNTNCEEVKKQITDIGTAASDDEFEDFTKRYEQAYKSYRLFVNSYSGICDISDLISNLSTLDEATDRLEMLKSIRQIEETEDALMCSKKLQIESLLNAYASLDEDKQAAIYNIDSLREINADVQVASALRIQVDTLRSGEGGYSLLDEDTVKKLRADYEQMTDRQKRYFGSSYLNQLEAIERQLDAENMNAALRVSSLINQIGTVNAKAKDRIESARKAYDALSEAQKAYVANLTTLETAETSLSKLEFSIAKATVSSLGSYRYSGTALTPSFTVSLNGVKLVQDLDYSVTYLSNKNVGTAKVVICGKGVYTNSLTKTFTIRPETMASAVITGCKAKYSYTGKQVKPLIQVVWNGKILRNNTDYTLLYKNNKKRGSAGIVVTGKGNYSGTLTASFTIVRASVKKASVTGLKAVYARTGKAVKPKVTVKLGGKKLKKKRDYILSYRKNKKKGTALLYVKGVGNYSGTKKMKFKIR